MVYISQRCMRGIKMACSLLTQSHDEVVGKRLYLTPLATQENSSLKESRKSFVWCSCLSVIASDAVT